MGPPHGGGHWWGIWRWGNGANTKLPTRAEPAGHSMPTMHACIHTLHLPLKGWLETLCALHGMGVGAECAPAIRSCLSGLLAAKASPRRVDFGPSMAPVAAPPACPTRANTPTLWLHPHVFAMPAASHLAHHSNSLELNFATRGVARSSTQPEGPMVATVWVPPYGLNLSAVPWLHAHAPFACCIGQQQVVGRYGGRAWMSPTLPRNTVFTRGVAPFSSCALRMSDPATSRVYSRDSLAIAPMVEKYRALGGHVRWWLHETRRAFEVAVVVLVMLVVMLACIFFA